MSENRIRVVDSAETNPALKPGYGPRSAGIHYEPTYDYLAINPDGTVRAFSEYFHVTQVLTGTEPATAANYGPFWIAPFACTVVGVKCRFETASSSGTLMINKAPSGTATDSGTAVLASTMSTAGSANTNVTGTLHATASNLDLAAGDALGLVDGGTLTSSAGLTVTVTLKRKPGAA